MILSNEEICRLNPYKNIKTNKLVEKNELHIGDIHPIFTREIIVQKHNLYVFEEDCIVFKGIQYSEKKVIQGLCSDIYKPNI